MSTIDRDKLLSLWRLEDLPACDDGMDLAHRFLERAVDALEPTDDFEVIGQRNALIRAHKAFIDHRVACPKCNEEEIPTASIKIR